VTSKFDNISLM